MEKLKGIPTKRILTYKSTFNFGRFGTYTMTELIALNKKQLLIHRYYHVTSIDYIEELLNELNIVGEWRIEKPGKNEEMYVRFAKENHYKTHRDNGGADKLKKRIRPQSKARMQYKNHHS